MSKRIFSGRQALLALLSISLFSLAVVNGQQDTMVDGPQEQPLNRLYTISLEGLTPKLVSVSDISQESFQYGQIPFKPSEPTPFQQVEKIHPLLEKMIAKRVPNDIVEVVITFQEDLEVPRLPNLRVDVSRSSSVNQRLLNTRMQMIEELKQSRERNQASLIEKLKARGFAAKDQFWLTNSVSGNLTVNNITAVADMPEVAYIQPRFGGEAPPIGDGNTLNDVSDARRQLQSDPYFAAASSFSFIGVLDTGVFSAHTLLSSPSNLFFVRDCVNGDSSCLNAGDSLYNPGDTCNHGTSTMAIISGNGNLGDDYRGVTRDIVDSFKVYKSCGLDTAATLRGFQAALSVGDHVIVAEMQAIEGETGAIATAADNAYTAGASIVAANGNFGPGASTVRSPAVAHKVLGAGAYDVLTGTTYKNQGLGPAPDGRFKPDLQGPNNTETASTASTKALQVFTGTSGSTPYVSATTALTRDWLITAGFNNHDNGQVYAWMITQGDQAYPFNNTRGAGRIRMLLGGTATVGKVIVVNGGSIDILFSAQSFDRRMEAAIWWPETAAQAHSDIDIRLFDPSNVERAFSISGPSIFELVRFDGSPTVAAGLWRLRIEGFSIPTGSQVVYFAVHNTSSIPAPIP